MTAAPWVLACPVVTATLPQPAVVAVSLPPRVAIDVAWPRVRVVNPRVPPAPGVIHLGGASNVSFTMPLPGAHPLRTGWSPPPRAPRARAAKA